MCFGKVADVQSLAEVHGQVDAADVLAYGVACARLRLFEATSLTARSRLAFPLHPWAHPTAEMPAGEPLQFFCVTSR
jgi:hypothetical protein